LLLGFLDLLGVRFEIPKHRRDVFSLLDKIAAFSFKRVGNRLVVKVQVVQLVGKCTMFFSQDE
jgi:hypothetical protein